MTGHLRSILGYAIFAALVVTGLKIAIGVIGGAFSLALTVTAWAGLGYLSYAALRAIAPSQAAQVRSLIRGTPEVGAKR